MCDLAKRKYLRKISHMFWMILVLCSTSLLAATNGPVHPKAGADQSTPSKSQYSTWINNTNEGTTEEQTLANLAFFKWLHDEFGMVLDIYAFDAGFVDGKDFSVIMNQSDRFKEQFPNGLTGVVKAAAAMGTRLGHWGGPDGFGNTPAEEQARIDMMVGLCRDFNWALFKFDQVCGDLRPEKETAFIRMMKESRRYSPDLIALNHRLPLGSEGLALMTTSLWDGQETYIDVHIGNKTTAPHHRAAAISRGNTEGFGRLFEDCGVCISSCLDCYDDDMILQAFGRNLVLAPEVYGNPWLLRDDEFPKFARIFNLARRYRDILVHAISLPEATFGPNAVSRGDSTTRLLTLSNLTWEPVTYTLPIKEIGLAPASQVEVRQLHPTEKIVGAYPSGGSCAVTVPAFRACLLLATTTKSPEVGVAGCDYEVVRDTPDKPVLVRLLGEPGTTVDLTLLPGNRTFSAATLSGKPLKGFTNGDTVSVSFEGTPLKNPWHRKLATLAVSKLPADAEALYEATCFAADNNAFEARSVIRSGPTKIPAVKAARDAFFSQRTFVGRGIWDRYLFDGDPATTFYVNRRGRRDARTAADQPLRIDFGAIITPDTIELSIPNQFALGDLLEGEGGSKAEFSADLKSWTTIPFVHREKSRIRLPKGLGIRYMRIPRFYCCISEVNAYVDGEPLSREAWRASNLFTAYTEMKFMKAWSGSVKIEEFVKGGYLCVALNGKHGVEGAYVALRTKDGKYIGAPDRAISFPCNAFENGARMRYSGYTYYFPFTPEMVGQEMEVVVLAKADASDQLVPEVWQTAYAKPFVEKLMELK
jgi:hypothetical protein